ncbi:MAG: hypothetical protein ACOYMN_26015 [Roseimicrobium sp.]
MSQEDGASDFFSELRDQAGVDAEPDAPPPVPLLDPQVPLDDLIGSTAAASSADASGLGALIAKLEVLDARVAARLSSDKELAELRAELSAMRNQRGLNRPTWLVALITLSIAVPLTLAASLFIASSWRTQPPGSGIDLAKAEADKRAVTTRLRAEDLAVKATEEFNRLRSEPAINAPVPELANNPRRTQGSEGAD